MHITTQYQTFNRGRQSSDVQNIFDAKDSKCFCYAGSIQLNQTVQVTNPSHLWLSSSQPLTIRAVDSQNNVALVNGVYLYSANFENVVSLSIDASIGDLYTVDPIVELQIFADNLTVEEH